jgi:methylenetetrahydrofolate dehydrogenase (NADP+)/methenyltetrahydrofolate cyclohydrolase
MKEGAEVFSFNKFIDLKDLINITKQSDIIVSATGRPHLVDERFIKDDGSQILIDVGWEVVNGKPTGDINFEAVKDKVKAISPVPG